jgi:hypothetical protein
VEVNMTRNEAVLKMLDGAKIVHPQPKHPDNYAFFDKDKGFLYFCGNTREVKLIRSFFSVDDGYKVKK